MPLEDNRSMVDVLQDILGNVQGLIRAEVKLAKAEVKEEAQKASRAAIVIAAGAVVGIYAVWLLLLTCLYALGLAIPMWAAALTLFVVTAVLAAVLLSAGKKRLQTVKPKPERTMETMRENVQWAKHQTR